MICQSPSTWRASVANSEPPRVLLDSCALLALIKNEAGAERLDSLMAMIGQGQAQLVESVLVLGEVYKRSDTGDPAERERQDQKLEEIRRLLKSREVLLLDATAPVGEKATELRLKYNLKLADAVHLATAVLNRCNWFVTFDKDFAGVTDVRVFRIDRLHGSSDALPWDRATQDPLPLAHSNVLPISAGQR